MFPGAIDVDCRTSFTRPKVGVPLFTFHLRTVDSVDSFWPLAFSHFVGCFLWCHPAALSWMSMRASSTDARRWKHCSPCGGSFLFCVPEARLTVPGGQEARLDRPRHVPVWTAGLTL